MEKNSEERIEITFAVETDLECGAFTPSWDDPAGGGITTQANTLAELAEAIREAVACHFADGPAPQRASLHFTDA